MIKCHMPKNYFVQNDAQKSTINAMIIGTKEVIYRKRQGTGPPYIIHVKRIPLTESNNVRKDFYNERSQGCPFLP